MAISQNFPDVRPSLNLNFARSKTLDPRITFERASIGTYVDENGLIKTAAADEARFDHDPETGESLGLLIEEQRTNKRTISEAFNSWSQSNVVTTANTTISPDGQQTADEVYATSNGVNTGYVGGGASSFNQNEWHTFSIFWKAGTSNGFNLQLPWSDPNNAGVVCLFRLVNGELVASPPSGYGNFELASTPTTVTKYPNDWWRVSLTFRPTGVPSGSVLSIWIYPSYDTNNIRTTNLTSYFWGAQVEEGSFPTSYMPTSGSQFTREPDNAYITGTNFSSWYNQSEGTIFAESSAADVTDPYVVEIVGSTGGNDLIALGISNLYNQLRANSNGSQVVTIIASAIASKTFYKQSAGIAVNNFALSINGGSVVSDTSSPLPTVNLVSLNLGYSQFTSGRYLNGHIKQLRYYPERLTNTQLQNLTK